MMNQDFEGLVAIVTGGASGIGAAVTRRLLDSGAHVAVLDLDVSAADPDAFTVRADVGDDASVCSAVDILINNAGIVIWRPSRGLGKTKRAGGGLVADRSHGKRRPVPTFCPRLNRIESDPDGL